MINDENISKSIDNENINHTEDSNEQMNNEQEKDIDQNHSENNDVGLNDQNNNDDINDPDNDLDQNNESENLNTKEVIDDNIVLNDQNENSNNNEKSQNDEKCKNSVFVLFLKHLFDCGNSAGSIISEAFELLRTFQKFSGTKTFTVHFSKDCLKMFSWASSIVESIMSNIYIGEF